MLSNDDILTYADGHDDNQGTLAPIVKTPSAATPTKDTLLALETLAADPQNIVYIISGRDGEFLETHLGHIKNLGMSAEHGGFIREPGSSTWSNFTESLDMSWMSEALEIFKYYTEVRLSLIGYQQGANMCCYSARRAAILRSRRARSLGTTVRQIRSGGEYIRRQTPFTLLMPFVVSSSAISARTFSRTTLHASGPSKVHTLL